MHHTTILEALLLASSASAATLARRQQQPQVICDGARFPDVDACELIVAGLGWRNNPTGTTPIPDGSDCVTFNDRQHTANCQILVCNRVAGSPPISNTDANNNYNAISNTCIIGQEAGGASNSPDGLYQIQAWNDPLYNQPDSNLNRVSTVSKRRAIDIEMSGTTFSELALRKRQQAGDNSATISVFTDNVEAPGSRQQITARLPAGSSYTTTQADAKTTGIDSSFGLDAGFFDLFTASASITVSTSYTVTSTTGVTVLVQCKDGQQGQLFWSPLFSRFQGNFQPSGDSFDVYIPKSESAGSYAVECLG